MAKLTGSVAALKLVKPRAIKERLEDVDLTRSEEQTYIGIVLDSSGSMLEHYNQAVAGFNRQLNAIRQNVEHDAYTWLCLFGTPDVIEWPIVKGEVADLYDLNSRSYTPYGSTPLLDAICNTIYQMEQEDTHEKNQAFLVMAFSDGEENASRRYGWGDLRAAVESKDKRWTFVFIGPKGEHRKFQRAGYRPENLLEWHDTKMKALMDKSAFALGRFLQARNIGKLLPAFFTKDEQDA